LTTVLRMNERVITLSETVKSQQQRIEDLTGRVIRLETALELAVATRRGRSLPPGRQGVIARRARP